MTPLQLCKSGGHHYEKSQVFGHSLATLNSREKPQTAKRKIIANF